MRPIPTMLVLVLAQFAATGCASVPTPATKAPDSPASATAAEGRLQKLELFDLVQAPGAPPPQPSPAMTGMDHSKMDHSAPEAKPVASDPSSETYTCVMHAQIQQPKPGKCPICGMALEKKAKEKK